MSAKLETEIGRMIRGLGKAMIPGPSDGSHPTRTMGGEALVGVHHTTVALGRWWCHDNWWNDGQWGQPSSGYSGHSPEADWWHDDQPEGDGDVGEEWPSGQWEHYITLAQMEKVPCPCCKLPRALLLPPLHKGKAQLRSCQGQ